jgi:sulfonate transport system substrate-binding protein
MLITAMEKFATCKNRTVLCLSLLLLTALLFSACQPAEEPLHYGGQIYAGELLLHGLDVWSPYDLKIEHVLFTNPDDLVQAFRSGVVDIALFSDLQAARVFTEMGDQALIIAGSERGDRMSTLVRADSGIQSWADLQGKKVALRSGSGVELALKRYFKLHPQ